MSDPAVEANDVFAAFYDDFTSGYDHADWAGSLERLALAAGLSGRRALDVACGTGNSFLPLLDRGYEVTAVDSSPAMVARAREKAGGRARVLVADMRELPALGEFDLATCVLDALNYLLGEDELTAAFRGVRANLAPGGVLVFDVSTLGTFRSVHSSLRVWPAPERVLLFDGQGPPDLEPGAAAEAWIERLTPGADGCWRRERGVHVQRHHPAERLDRCLRAAGFEPVSAHGSHLSGQLDEGVDELRHVKAVYVARVSAG